MKFLLNCAGMTLSNPKPSDFAMPSLRRNGRKTVDQAKGTRIGGRNHGPKFQFRTLDDFVLTQKLLGCCSGTQIDLLQQGNPMIYYIAMI